MSYIAYLCGRNIRPKDLYEQGIRLDDGYSVMVACVALWATAAKAFVERHKLGPIAAVVAPQECYPYPGNLSDCRESWRPPLEVAVAAERYAGALRNLKAEEREALRQGIYEWGQEDKFLLPDKDLDAAIAEMARAMEDLNLQARRIAELGEDLMLVALG